MNGRVALDTNIIIGLFAKDPNIMEQLENTTAVFIPSIVVGELYYGAFHSTKKQSNASRIDEFVSNSSILQCTAETARYYGHIKTELRQKGKPVPENDIWIASLAMQYNLTLISRDAHFFFVDDLQVEVW